MTETSLETIDTLMGLPSTEDFVADGITIVRRTQDYAYRSVNVAMIARNWLLGRRIVEEELVGGNSENYGNKVIVRMSEELTRTFGKGFTTSNLYMFSRFYRMFPEMFHTLCGKSRVLSWSHYRELIRVPSDSARAWYHEQAVSEGWSVRTLSRNISTQYYYRIAGNPSPDDNTQDAPESDAENETERLAFIKNPLVLEFLNIPKDEKVSESDLEAMILNNLQSFLLELGRGFAFVARQKHIRTETRDFYIDLVFYNFDLRCFVLIDLKTGPLTHQDIGQMDMYVRMYDELERREGDNPTIGMILCSDTDRDIVHYSVLNDRDQLYAAKFLKHLPSEAELRREIEAQKEIYRQMESRDPSS